MNFEFLKGLCGLDRIYENCNNAEKLAMTMPMQSMFTSRKSAELLAKFIYMASHKQEMEGISFADILADPAVRDFLHSRDIMDAFHYIRKSGNRAAHGEYEENSEDAIAVLQDLHYVTGETACILGLIDDYPIFEDHLKEYPEEKYFDEQDINALAIEMFADYIEKLDELREQNLYIEEQDYDSFTYAIEGNVEMHEFLDFKFKPKQTEIIDFLQNYLSSLVRLSIERAPEKSKELELHDPVIIDAKLSIESNTYTSAKLESFVDAIVNKLPKANGFSIDLSCSGVLREFYHDSENAENPRLNMIRRDTVWTGAGMLDILEQFKRRNAFDYKLAIYYPDSGEFKYEKIINGKDIDVFDLCTEDIIDKQFNDDWWSLSLSLGAEFDFDKYADKLEGLRNLVRGSIPNSELIYCEQAWTDGDHAILCNNIQWNCSCLREVQDFLDKVNIILLSIDDDYDIICEGTWEVKSEFAIATWIWTPQGFKIIGCCY